MNKPNELPTTNSTPSHPLDHIIFAAIGTHLFTGEAIRGIHLANLFNDLVTQGITLSEVAAFCERYSRETPLSIHVEHDGLSQDTPSTNQH